MRAHTTGFLESLLLPLLRALLPARGRHRGRRREIPAQLPLTTRPLPQRRTEDHEYDTPLVRPYLLTPHERRHRRLQRQRRRALWLATHGIDVGPRHIHGVEVST
ncbi:hypothetical protein [Streptomyces sp. NPDC000983]|uniref:hypothetical protein n=1 Tax=Streptomyces sp. NPDC000983 TaxID=3154373 RepID=UPI003331501B